MTEVVVDELSILPYNASNIEFKWPDENRRNDTAYVAPEVKDAPCRVTFALDEASLGGAGRLERSGFSKRLPRFDIAVASSAEEIDTSCGPIRE